MRFSDILNDFIIDDLSRQQVLNVINNSITTIKAIYQRVKMQEIVFVLGTKLSISRNRDQTNYVEVAGSSSSSSTSLISVSMFINAVLRHLANWAEFSAKI